MPSSQLTSQLADILDNEDGRTLIEMRESEPHYDITVEKANYDGEGTGIIFDGSTSTYLSGREVKVGDVVTIWDGHEQPFLGGERHGWAHNGELVEWLTPFERVAKRVQWLADYDRRNREKLEQGAEKRAADYARLPQPLKDRLDRFAAERSDFWMSGGDYELFCCIEAAKIADHLRPRVEAGEDPDQVVSGFRDAWDTSVVSNEHSGNTFSGACSLAWALLRGEPV